MNENKNVNCAVNGKEMVAVDLKELLSVYADMKRMYYMLKTLIATVQQEEKLKQHHRPYLELRREMIGMCEKYLRDLAEIALRSSAPVKSCPIDCCAECEMDKNPDAVKVDKKNNKVVFEMIDDLLVLVEHTDNLRSFVKLLMNGVPLGEVAVAYDDGVARDVSVMVDRWEAYATAAIAEDIQ